MQLIQRHNRCNLSAFIEVFTLVHIESTLCIRYDSHALGHVRYVLHDVISTRLYVEMGSGFILDLITGHRL